MQCVTDLVFIVHHWPEAQQIFFLQFSWTRMYNSSVRYTFATRDKSFFSHISIKNSKQSELHCWKYKHRYRIFLTDLKKKEGPQFVLNVRLFVYISSHNRELL